MASVCPTCHARFSNEAQYCPIDGSETRPATLDEPQPADAWIGKRIDDRYLIEAVIGSGGMGVVYEVTHERLRKKMAIKVLRPELARVKTIVERFLREAQTASSIGHPNIAAVTDFGHLPDGTPYFVMELLEGESLAARIDTEGPLSVNDALDIVDQMAGALSAAHALGVVHRDLKPDNVFLAGRPGELPIVKLLDFGIAKAGGELSKITQTGTLFGTPHYMSPEQAAGQDVDFRTDIYALGIIVYEMLTGSVPFEADTFLGVLAKQMFEQHQPITLANARLGPLERPLERALMKRPEERTQDAKTFALELRVAAEGISTDDRKLKTQPDIAVSGAGARLRTKTGEIIERLARESSPRPLTFSTPPPPRRGRALLAGTLVLGALAVVAFFARGGGHTEALAGAATTASARETEAPPTTPGDTPSEPPRASVRIVTRPTGALLWVDGAVVGHTPLSIPRPSVRLDASLSLEGYDTRALTLSATTTDEITVELLRSQPSGASTRMQNVPPRVQAQTPSTPMESAPTVMTRMAELVDPWR